MVGLEFPQSKAHKRMVVVLKRLRYDKWRGGRLCLGDKAENKFSPLSGCGSEESHPKFRCK